MKSILIKLGKVWAVIRQDGLMRGGRRALVALGSLFRPIGSGEILFVSGGVGDSARYRTRHVAEELTLHGFKAQTTVQDHPGLWRAAEHFQIFIFHRTLVTLALKRLITRLKELGKTIIFETDDLVHDPQYLPYMDYWQKMNALEKKQYEHGVGGEILADPSVRVATTTTNFLADKLRAIGKRVFIVPNKLSQQDVRWAKATLEKKVGVRSQEQVRIGYLSGTPSHNKDFATITKALLQLFAKYPHMELVLAGPLETESALNQYASRIKRLPFVSRDKLFGNIVSLDINVAPLEMGNPFCESKSELKFFEAGIVKVPTVAAATDTFRSAIMDGVDGSVASTTEEWVAKIGQLIEDQAFRASMGERAYETTLKRYTTEHSNNEEYYQFLRNQLNQTI